MAAPSLRTVRAVFPHTALQLAVSSSGISRGEEGRVRCEQPSSREGDGEPPQGWPPSSFDAVAQRRDHALPPDRAFRLGHRLGPLHRALVCDIEGAHLTRSAGHASTFLPPFPKAGFAARPFRFPRFFASGHCSTTKALTPGQLTHIGQVSPLTPLCLRNIQPSTTSWSPLRAVTLALAVRPFGPGFAIHSQARHSIPPKQVRHPTGCSFASGCSPPALANAQLPSASHDVTSHGTDSHCTDKASSRTHERATPWRSWDVDNMSATGVARSRR